MSKSPAAIVKEKFGEKSKLVAALAPFAGDEGLWVKRLNEAKGLERVSNAKLLKLYRVLAAVKEKFGSRVKLVDAICDLEKRAKDAGYKARLSAYAVPRLYDLYVSASRRAGVKVAPLASMAGEASAAPAKAAAEKVETAAAKKKPAAAKTAASAKPAKQAGKSKSAPAKRRGGKPAGAKKSGR